MNARRFYDERRPTQTRSSTRNTHNFLKAALLSRYLAPQADVLDLGCGQGGDVLKLRHHFPRSYRGIDVSARAVHVAKFRLRRALKCPIHVERADFSRDDWAVAPRVDLVNCQFALQYAFHSPARAAHVLDRIARVLRPGGVFVGTLPLHDAPSYTPVSFCLPDDERKCREYAVARADLDALCRARGLMAERWTPFADFYADMSTTFPALRATMRATVSPDPAYAVFVYRRSAQVGDEGVDVAGRAEVAQVDLVVPPVGQGAAHDHVEESAAQLGRRDEVVVAPLGGGHLDERRGAHAQLRRADADDARALVLGEVLHQTDDSGDDDKDSF